MRELNHDEWQLQWHHDHQPSSFGTVAVISLSEPWEEFIEKVALES